MSGKKQRKQLLMATSLPLYRKKEQQYSASVEKQKPNVLTTNEPNDELFLVRFIAGKCTTPDHAELIKLVESAKSAIFGCQTLSSMALSVIYDFGENSAMDVFARLARCDKKFFVFYSFLSANRCAMAIRKEGRDWKFCRQMASLSIWKRIEEKSRAHYDPHWFSEPEPMVRDEPYISDDD